MERKRIKVRSSLIGSSDVVRLHAKRAILEENHVKNVTFFASLKDNKKVVNEITEEYLIKRYSEVMVFGSWSPISKFIGTLVFMYNNSFRFK